MTSASDIPYIGLHQNIGITVTGTVVGAMAFGLLAVLFIKGWRSGTLGNYTLLYLLLANICIVWTC